MEQAVSLEAVKPSELPAPPKDAFRIVQTCSKPGVNSREVAALVANDPVLTAEVLRITNSAYFGFIHQVKSVTRAVTMLGHRALRNLVLCVSMREMLRKEDIPGLALDVYWEDALRRAVAARSLAEHAGLDAEECFTAGLLQDFGLLVMFYLQPDNTEHWDELSKATPEERLDFEIDLFHTTHDDVGKTLSESWGLPAGLALAMGHHHDESPEDENVQNVSLCKVSTCADWMASVYRCEDKRVVIEKSRALLLECFSISAEQADLLLHQVSESVKDAADAMGMRVGEQQSFEEVLGQANLCLAEENISYQELTWKLEQTLNERDQIAAALDSELQLAREVQKSLLPDKKKTPKGFAGINLSAKQVSGDFYDYFELADGKIAFCLADVSGKGMNAALLMAKTTSLYHCLGRGIHDPGKLLGMLNREICETSIRGMFVTMVAGVIDQKTGEVLLANAGHLPTLHMGSAALIDEFPAGGPPLGIMPGSEFKNQKIDLQEGCLYLYTDGLVEAWIGDERLEQDGLVRMLKEHSHLPIEQRVKTITEEVNSVDGAVEDDLTLVIVEGSRKRNG